MAFEVQHQVDLPEGELFRAQLKELEAVTIPYKDKKTNEDKEFTKLNWLFEVTEQGDYNGKTVRGETNAYISDSPYNKFGNFARALLGRDLAPGQLLAEDDLVGLSGLIEIKYEADRKDASKKFARVGEVYALDPASVGDEPPF